VIVVDSSVWIDHLRGTATAEVTKLHDLIGNEPLIVGDVILCEVLLGVPSERDARAVERALRSYDLVPMLGVEQAVRAAALYRALRGKGITIRKTIDLIIGAWCIAHGAKLLHSDKDFTLLEHHAGLAVV
jgi:predicted nucleic acid-binding protein